ncbi:MAG: hypothetical protein A2284_13895 [Deltaproteobacteria bacterium RIFOXYA12_FULL_61_11]|nr:MAG: hypothetical protein A2284_13895 [Deltaproteobacteria bacterium RIFOXYA12_FULL_61_11]
MVAIDWKPGKEKDCKQNIMLQMKLQNGAALPQKFEGIPREVEGGGPLPLSPVDKKRAFGYIGRPAV